MNTGTTRIVLLGLAALTTLAVAAGCAGESGSRRGAADSRSEAEAAAAYRDEIERAQASIADAERGGAIRGGSADLVRARQKLDAARRAADEGDVVRAERFAVEASLDADVALAAARNQEAQAAADELEASIRTLEDELRRNETRGLDRP